MSDSGMTPSQISAAGAYAQAERLAVSIPVRAIDPARQRFQVRDQVAAGEAPVQSRIESDADGESPAQSAGRQGGGARGGFGLLGAFTSFLARMFAQPESGSASTVAVATGAQAYARTANATAMTGDFGAAEVLSPSFPRLSSGRAVDLTV